MEGLEPLGNLRRLFVRRPRSRQILRIDDERHLVTDSFDSMNLKAELLRGISCAFMDPTVIRKATIDTVAKSDPHSNGPPKHSCRR